MAKGDHCYGRCSDGIETWGGEAHSCKWPREPRRAAYLSAASWTESTFQVNQNTRASLTGCHAGLPSRCRTKTTQHQETLSWQRRQEEHWWGCQLQKRPNGQRCSGEPEPELHCRSLNGSTGRAVLDEQPAPGTCPSHWKDSPEQPCMWAGGWDVQPCASGWDLQIPRKKPPCSFPTKQRILTEQA